MVIKYNTEINNTAILNSVNKFTNQIFKLLPTREEGGDWETPLKNLIVEAAGMARLLEDHIDLFPLICKMEGLLCFQDQIDFLQFRKTIFECLGLINKIKSCLD